MAGRPKGEQSFTQMLRIAINEAGKQPGTTKLRDIAAAVVSAAVDGKMDAIKEIADRLDGKPVQRNENNNTHDISDPLKELVKYVAANGGRLVKPDDD